MRKVVITGGAGFIGSHIVEHIKFQHPDATVVVLDKMTYAADFRNVAGLLNKNEIELIVGDICDFELCANVMDGCDLVIHAAAESHVDHSFHSALSFTRTNVSGTHAVLEAARVNKVPRFIHISTDEVYGEVLAGAADEQALLDPTNPYSASKAAAEMIIKGYMHSFNLPIIIVRANNVFGKRQFPEKLIPKCCVSLLSGRRIPLHGNGENTRHYLSANDLASAVELIARKGGIHEVYNVGSDEEYRNIDVAKMICQAMGIDFSSAIHFVADRPFNDRRYAVVWDKITHLGWSPKFRLDQSIASIVDWYRNNLSRYSYQSSLKEGPHLEEIGLVGFAERTLDPSVFVSRAIRPKTRPLKPASQPAGLAASRRSTTGRAGAGSPAKPSGSAKKTTRASSRPPSRERPSI